MSTLAVMQPTYMPWPGYFNLMARVDHFVILDDVQFERQSWQQRNRILLNGRPAWLSVPVRHPTDRPIGDIEIDDTQPWRDRHVRTLHTAYDRHPHGRMAAQTVERIIDDDRISQLHLGVLTTSVLLQFRRLMALTAKIHLASALDVAGERSARLVEFCRRLDCDTYLSAAGSRDYIEAEGHFRRPATPRVVYQKFESRPYPQRGAAEFTPHLAIVDLVANLGPRGAAEYVRQEDAA